MTPAEQALVDFVVSLRLTMFENSGIVMADRDVLVIDPETVEGIKVVMAKAEEAGLVIRYEPETVPRSVSWGKVSLTS